MRGLVMTVLCGGCHHVFGLAELDEDPPQDAIVDGPGDSNDAPLTCLFDDPVPLAPEADAHLSAAMPTTNAGAASRLTLADQDVILLRFRVPQPSSAITLSLVRAQTVPGCTTGSASCEACTNLDLTYAIDLVRSDWAEAAVTFAQRDVAMPWDSAGATGLRDVLAKDVCVGMTTNGAITCSALLRETDIQDGAVTFAVRGRSIGTITYRSLETSPSCVGASPQAFASCLCGNSKIETPEACDDGPGDGCDPNCTFPACGNGFLGPSEGCDDGNRRSDDGCSDTCQVEP